MERRKISAREAVDDIRSGMNDAELMKKYGLSSDGLQTLFDKLVNTGFIDLGEIRSRLTGYVGTVVVPEFDLFRKKDGVKDQPPKSKSARTINVQEAARDIRSGMVESALAAKYRLTPVGLTSLYDKLWSMGVLTEKDLDRRRLDTGEDTVDLREMKLELADAFKTLGLGSAPPSPAILEPESDQSAVKLVRESTTKKQMVASGQKPDRQLQKERRDVVPSEGSWYDKPIILILLLLGVFPLGFYGLYRTQRITRATKAVIVLGWFAFAVVWVHVFYGNIWEIVP